MFKSKYYISIIIHLNLFLTEDKSPENSDNHVKKHPEIVKNVPPSPSENIRSRGETSDSNMIEEGYALLSYIINL